MLEWGRTSAGTTPILRAGSVVASLSPAAQRDDAQADIGGKRFLFYAARDALWAERSGAEKPGLEAVRSGRRSWRVQTADVAYSLETAGGRGRFVVRRDGTEIGTATGRSRLRNATLDLGVDVPLPHEVFLLWLVGSRHRGPKGQGSGGSTIGPTPAQSALDGGFIVGGL